MIRDVLRMGDPRLLERSREVLDVHAPEIATLLADMRDTMRAQNGAGLAAPQIGAGVRVVIFGVERNPRYPDVEPVPYTELINPVLSAFSDDMEEGWEGCLSVPGLRGLVARHARLRYRGLHPSGERDRAGRRRVSRASRAARVRPPRRHSLSNARAGFHAIRLHRRAVSRACRLARRLKRRARISRNTSLTRISRARFHAAASCTLSCS